MKLEVNEEGTIVLKEVFSGIILETEEGNRLGICMRDDTFEFNMSSIGEARFRVNPETLDIEKLDGAKDLFGKETPLLDALQALRKIELIKDDLTNYLVFQAAPSAVKIEATRNTLKKATAVLTGENQILLPATECFSSSKTNLAATKLAVESLTDYIDKVWKCVFRYIS